MTKLLQCLRDELVRRDYAAPTIRTYIQIVSARGLGDDVVAIVNEEDGHPVVTLARR